MSRRSVLIEALAVTPRDIERMTRRVSDEAALQRPAPDEWCIADVVAHLAYVELRFQGRFRRILAEEHPQVGYILPDPSAHDLARPLGEHVAALAALRAETIAWLNDLEQRDWGRMVTVEGKGDSRLRDQVQNVVSHDNEHMNQLLHIREMIDERQATNDDARASNAIRNND